MGNLSFENEKLYSDYLNYLYEVAAVKYSDCSDIDSLVQDSLMALIVKIHKKEKVEYPKGFLSSVLKNKYNDWLRRKYRESAVLCEYDEFAYQTNVLQKEEDDIRSEEYDEVRREIGRLQQIYREVTVRFYVHGHSVEKISQELNIPKGTVLSRLSNARSQIKEGIENMEKYSQISYEPKYLSIGIQGSLGLSGEPNSLVRSSVEQNILILAYENPVSVRGIADSIGMPSAYVEDIVNRLVAGELMGRTERGLVYTRFFMRNYDDSFGDIPAQEAIAERKAEDVWNSVSKHFKLLEQCDSFVLMSEKQKATLCIIVMVKALQEICMQIRNELLGEEVLPPERPNGGRWLATGTVRSKEQVFNYKYEFSGPLFVAGCNGGKKCRLLDFQSSFGATHWAYNKMKYKFSNGDCLSFLASFVPGGVKSEKTYMYELIPDFEKLNILKRNSSGEVCLDIPTLTFEDEKKFLYPAYENIKKDLFLLLKDDIKTLFLNSKQTVPKHIDCYQYYRNASAINAYFIAQIYAIVEKNLMPYRVEIGKTPIMLLTYGG